jgi:peroxiredoxin
VGAPAPGLRLQTLSGDAFTLADTLAAGQHVLLVFLRHLGCLPCRQHIADLVRHKADLDDLNARVVVVSFGTAPVMAQWLAATQAPFSVGLDPERVAYRAYGLERSYWRSRSPRTRWFYLRAWLAGTPIPRPFGDDPSQLGGDFLIDRHGRLRLAHPSRDPLDRPTAGTVLEALARLNGA